MLFCRHRWKAKIPYLHTTPSLGSLKAFLILHRRSTLLCDEICDYEWTTLRTRLQDAYFSLCWNRCVVFCSLSSRACVTEATNRAKTLIAHESKKEIAQNWSCKTWNGTFIKSNGQELETGRESWQVHLGYRKLCSLRSALRFYTTFSKVPKCVRLI